MAKQLPYRPCVGIALFNTEGKIFVGERLDNPGAWQMPQGGIDEGETVEQAFFREMREEIGTDQAKILKIHDKPLRYDLPPRLRGRLWGGKWGGQEQTWVAARFTGLDKDVDIDAHNPPEFGRWKWVKLEDVLDLIVPFKRDTYREVIRAFEGVLKV
ncbi:MAG TPA: RNA pyrophosphohydrolase [Patescibacteria group bacterium]|nr:RNA pyrophosphohydrolase [Patescibacteria group bacterium]